MAYVNVTYGELLTYADKFGIQVIDWDRCKLYIKLGTGAAMIVSSGTYEVNGKIHNVAFKTVNTKLSEKTTAKKLGLTLRDVKQEIRVMGSLKGHSRITQLLGVSFNDHMPVLILELAKSNLEEYLRSKQVEWNIKLGFMYDIALGLEAIHKIKFVHGDLKATNILVFDDDDNQVVAKISDFGYSSADLSVQKGYMPGSTRRFCSPECFDDGLKEWEGKPTTDIYSYGLVVYQIANDGTAPFEEYHISEIDDIKKEGTELACLKLPDGTPEQIREIMEVTVRNKPSERFELNEVKRILKQSTEWNQVYSYEEARTVFESTVLTVVEETIAVSKMMELSIPPKLKKRIFLDYQQFSIAGDVVSKQKLGYCWYVGFGTDQNYSEAFECYREAAESGNVIAQISLGLCYDNGQGVTQDYIKAFELYEKAAKAGNPIAQYNLGVCYRVGDGVAEDIDKAIELFTKAADAGNVKAQCSLGVCYENGEGVSRDIKKAVELYIKAADSGDITAQNNLGICYENGDGIPKDYVKAFELYTKAAEAGSSSAQNNLGRCYHYGYGVTKDYVKAFELYTKASEAGDELAQYGLNILSEEVEERSEERSG